MKPKQKKQDISSLPFYAAGWFCRKVNRLSGAVWVGGKTTTQALTNNPGIKASLNSMVMLLTTGEAEVHEISEETEKNADHIIQKLKSKGISPERLAVDGLPGSGKSTLARAMAKRLDFKWKTLDYINMNKPLNFKKGRIYEHHRLFRTQNINHFDAIIYIDEPIELSKKKCVRRKRGASNVDIFNYKKLKSVGKAAFESAEGEVYLIPESYIKMKIRPEGGFRAYENIRDVIKRNGLKTKNRCKEELLYLSVYGKAKSGLMAYINFGAYKKELKKGLSAGMSKYFT